MPRPRPRRIVKRPPASAHEVKTSPPDERQLPQIGDLLKGRGFVHRPRRQSSDGIGHPAGFPHRQTHARTFPENRGVYDPRSARSTVAEFSRPTCPVADRRAILFVKNVDAIRLKIERLRQNYCASIDPGQWHRSRTISIHPCGLNAAVFDGGYALQTGQTETGNHLRSSSRYAGGQFDPDYRHRSGRAPPQLLPEEDVSGSSGRRSARHFRNPGSLARDPAVDAGLFIPLPPRPPISPAGSPRIRCPLS